MINCTPFLLFDGNCAEAMTFYHQCLGGELTLTKLGETPMKDQFPPEKHNRMINAHLKSGALEISATDWMASPAFEPKQGNTYAIFRKHSLIQPCIKFASLSTNFFDERVIRVSW